MARNGWHNDVRNTRIAQNSYTNKDEYDETHHKGSSCNGSGGSVAAIV